MKTRKVVEILKAMANVLMATVVLIESLHFFCKVLMTQREKLE